MDFFNDIFHNLALLEFYFLNIIYILLYIDFITVAYLGHDEKTNYSANPPWRNSQSARAE